MREGGAASAKEIAGERAKSKSVRPLRALGPFLWPHRRLIWAALAALLFSAALTLAVPTALRRVVDLGEDGAAEAQIDQYFIALILLAMALGLATALRFYFISRLGERVVADIRRAVYDRVVGFSPQFFETVRTGETLSRLTTDTAVIQSVVGSASSIALRNIILFFGASTMMLLTSPKLTGMAFLIVPLVVGPIIVLGRRLRSLARLAQDKIAESSAIAGETLGALRDVQAFTWESRARGQFALAAEAAYDAAHRRILTRSLLTGIVIFLIFGAVAGVLWAGWRDVLDGRMTPGELTQFLLYAVFTAGSVGALSEIWGQLQHAAGASERLAELLHAESPVREPQNPTPMPEPRGEVAFEAVDFHYPSRPKDSALNGFSLRVKPGETVALVGPSGAGKTTVLHLLQRFYDPQSGVIRIDGVDLREAALAEFRARLAVVPQEPVILAASVAENIRFGRPDADDAAVIEAARAAAAHDFIEALPQGYATPVGERGVLLSGGQKQRVAIARAILRDAPILLLDEATSALDAESEQAVQQAVAKMAETRTTLVVAHRLATVKRADRIVVIEAGRITAEGTHEALAAQEGVYARLAKLQFC